MEITFDNIFLFFPATTCFEETQLRTDATESWRPDEKPKHAGRGFQGEQNITGATHSKQQDLSLLNPYITIKY